MAETIKLGKMERDWGAPVRQSKADEKEPMVERFPTIYVSMESLPELKPGQEVILKGVVASFTDRKVRSKEDGKTEVETSRQCEIDVIEMTPGEKKAVGDPPDPTDEEDIEKGLDEASEKEE